MARLLLVEDEPGLVLTLGDRLRGEGHAVQVVEDGLLAESEALAGDHDAIILDVMLPGQDGMMLCRRLRRQGVETPILMLTALQAVDDRVRGLRLGADDYLGKPFDSSELLARVDALLRRAPVAAKVERIGRIEIDQRATRVLRDGIPLALPARIYRLLAFLLNHAGEDLGRDRLLDEVWGRDAMPDPQTVDVHIAWLRRELEPEPARPRYILTVRGVGYRLVR